MPLVISSIGRHLKGISANAFSDTSLRRGSFTKFEEKRREKGKKISRGSIYPRENKRSLGGGRGVKGRGCRWLTQPPFTSLLARLALVHVRTLGLTSTMCPREKRTDDIYTSYIHTYTTYALRRAYLLLTALPSYVNCASNYAAIVRASRTAGKSRAE